MSATFQPLIQPWLSVRNSAASVDFYKAAFGATETYRMDAGDGVVARLSIEGAEFWVSEESTEQGNLNPQPASNTVRFILIVADPDAVFARARQAGASEVYPVSEEHGWRIGRVVDPFGHHWEIGHPIAD
jgi:PhnB protein